MDAFNPRIVIKSFFMENTVVFFQNIGQGIVAFELLMISATEIKSFRKLPTEFLSYKRCLSFGIPRMPTLDWDEAAPPFNSAFFSLFRTPLDIFL